MISIDLKDIIKNLNVKKFQKDWLSPINTASFKKKYGIENDDDLQFLKENFSLKSITIRYSANENLDIEKYIELFNSGITYKNIAKELGLSRDHAVVIRSDLGLKGREVHGRYSVLSDNEEQEKFKKLVLEGKTIKELAKEFSVKMETVSNWKKKLGLTSGLVGRGGDRWRMKIARALEENYGALTIRELKDFTNIYNTKGETFEDVLKRHNFGVLFLDLQVIELRIKNYTLKPSDIFEADLNSSLVFFNNHFDAAALKFAKMLRVSPAYTGKGGGNKFPFMIRKKEVLLDILNSIKGAEFLRERIDYILKLLGNKSEIKTAETACRSECGKFKKNQFEVKKSDTRLSDNVKTLLSSSRTKFFGRKNHPKKFWKEILNCNGEEKILKIKEVFISLGFSIKEKNEEYVDFVLSGPNESFVKIIDENFDEMDSFEFEQKFHEKGILISFNEINDDIKNRGVDRINIEIGGIKTIIFSLKYLPINENCIAKVMYGDHHSETVLVKKISLKNNSASVKNIFSQKEFDVLLGSLREHDYSNRIIKQTDEYISLITYLNELTHEDFMEELDLRYDIQILSKPGTIDLSANIDGKKISIKLNKHFRGETLADEIDVVHTQMLSCSGIGWSEHVEKLEICNHIGYVLYYLWMNKYKVDSSDYWGIRKEWKEKYPLTKILGKDGSFSTKSIILEFLREIYFRFRILPIFVNAELGKKNMLEEKKQKILKVIDREANKTSKPDSTFPWSKTSGWQKISIAAEKRAENQKASELWERYYENKGKTDPPINYSEIVDIIEIEPIESMTYHVKDKFDGDDAMKCLTKEEEQRILHDT